MSRIGNAAGAAGGGVLMLAIFALSIVNVVAVWSLALDVWHWPWLGAVLALLYNPVFRIHFERETWAVLNVLAAAALGGDLLYRRRSAE